MIFKILWEDGGYSFVSDPWRRIITEVKRKVHEVIIAEIDFKI